MTTQVTNFNWERKFYLTSFLKHMQGKPYEVPAKNGQNFIQQLPREILLPIFNYLNYKNHAKLKRVCKSWNTLIGKVFCFSDYQRILQTVNPLLNPVDYQANQIGNRARVEEEFSLYGKWNPEDGLELKCTNFSQKTFEIILKYALRSNHFSSKKTHYIYKVEIRTYSDSLTIMQLNIIKKASEVWNQAIYEEIWKHVEQSTSNYSYYPM